MTSTTVQDGHVLHGESWERQVSQIPKTDCHVAVPHHLLQLGERACPLEDIYGTFGATPWVSTFEKPQLVL